MERDTREGPTFPAPKRAPLVRRRHDLVVASNAISFDIGHHTSPCFWRIRR